MINLNSSTRLQAFLGGAITTREINYFVTYADRVTATGVTSLAVTVVSKSSGTSDVDICSAPAAGTIRSILGIIAANVDTASVECTIQLEDGSDWPFTPFTISANRMAQFTKEGQWVEYSAGSGGGIADGDTLSTGLTFPNTGLHLLDTNASHDLIIAPGSDLTADRTLTVTTGDASRTLTLSGNATLSGGTHSGTNTGDQTISLTGDVTGSGTGSFAASLAYKTFSWSFVWSGRVLRGLGTATGTHLDSTVLTGADSNLSLNSDPDGCFSGYNMADGAASDLLFQFPVPVELDLTAVVTATVYYRLAAAGTGAAVEIEFIARNVADNEVDTSGGTLFSVSGGSCIKSVNGYASGDLVVHSLGTVFGANTLDATSIIHGTLYRDAFAGNGDDTFGNTVMMGAIQFTGTRKTT